MLSQEDLNVMQRTFGRFIKDELLALVSLGISLEQALHFKAERLILRCELLDRDEEQKAPGMSKAELEEFKEIQYKVGEALICYLQGLKEWNAYMKGRE